MASAIKASWTKLATSSQLQRSSHTLSTIGSASYVFGGELKPREPRDNDIHTIHLADNGSANVQTITPEAKGGGNASPSPRVGSASTVIEDKVYFFSGRGGTAMAPIEENGGVWSLAPTSNTWTLLRPSAGAAYPAARSYHALTSDGRGKIYLHAGCPESGRLSDLWAFDVSAKEWRQLASAPDPPRGGTSVAWAEGKVWRMNGFDGKTEQGGALDVYDPAEDSWSTIEFPADGKEGPGARSVAALVPVSVAGRGTYLVTLFGESDPSSLGHMGAGKMLSDVWAFEIGSGKWAKIEAADTPQGRGWFDADAVKTGGKDAVIVAGGLGEGNERLDDAWLLSF